jgi:beta-fructofuranosidase
MILSRRSVLASLALSAAASVAKPLRRALAEAHDQPLSDPLRPAFHLQPAHGWMNDPCGPIYWRGQYHMFYQYNPNAAVWGDMHWAHAVSPDMIHWKRLPIALAPTPDGPDAQGCFTGSAIVYNDRPHLLYTGVRTASPAEATINDSHNHFHESQCLALATDDTLRTWKKLPQPVIPSPPPGMHVTGFRDPAPWRDGDHFYTLIGSGIAGVGGNVLLYRSRDLHSWEYLHPMLRGAGSGSHGANPVDSGEMWECPDFFPLGTGDKHVLIYSTQGKTIWHSGTFDRATMLFHPERAGQLDFGSYYAPKTQLDAHGNRILWGWLPETRPEAEYSRAGWSGMISLPRILTLDGNDLVMQPAPQIERLRSSSNPNPGQLPNTRQDFRCILQSGGEGKSLPYDISDAAGPLLEIRSDKAQSPRTLRFGEVSIEMPRPLPAKANFRIFIDNSVMEIFVDNRFCVTRRFYNRVPAQPVVTLTLAGQSSVVNPQSFSLKSIWSA